MTSAPAPSGSTTLQTVDRALRVMEIVAESDGLTPRDVAKRLGINVTTCYHLVNTLLRSGYLIRGGDGTLRIGLKVSALYQGMQRNFKPAIDLRAVVGRLGAASGETVYLSTLHDDSVVIQLVVEGSKAVRVGGLYVGFHGAEHERASGKALLAFLDPIHRQSVLERAWASSGLTKAQRLESARSLESELVMVAAQGWALDDRQFQADICCVAAPYFDASGDVQGTIAISVPESRFDLHRTSLVTLVTDGARDLSSMLGYSPDAALALDSA